MNQLRALGESRRWRLMVEAARMAAEQNGMNLVKKPGRGLSNVWEIKRPGGSNETVSIRTTMDRWYAFPPLEKGSRWKTLDEADLVIVAAVDDVETPTAIEVYCFPADEVRDRFNASYAARTKAGMAVRDNFGMWVGLDEHKRGIPTDVGSGIAKSHPPIAKFLISDLLSEVSIEDGDEGVPLSEEELSDETPPTVAAASGEGAAPPETIADVIRDARERIAKIAGIAVDAVKLELKLEL